MKNFLFLTFSFVQFFALSTLYCGITSEEALKRLVEGNKRFVNDKSTCLNRNFERREETFAKQTPFAVILGCSDSRVPLEAIFDQGLGDLFVVRVAGNVAGLSEVESIEYAAHHLDSSIVLVLGHENCAAVAAVLKNEATDFPNIAGLIDPAIKSLKDKTIENAVKANVLQVVKTLKTSAYLGPVLKREKMEVIGGYYHLNTGLVEILDTQNIGETEPAATSVQREQKSENNQLQPQVK